MIDIPRPVPATGEPDARLAAALRGWQAAPGTAQRAAVLAALVDARVFVCVAARPTAEAVEMAVLTVVRTDGARVLPVFSDGHAVQRWRREARPVPVPAPQACAAALADGAAGVLLDPTGAALAVDADELTRLARGWAPVAGTSLASRRTTAALTAPSAPVDAALVEALSSALAGEPLEGARLLDGPEGPVLGLVPAPRAVLDPAGLAALASRVLRRLGAALPPDGLDVAVVPAHGPGHVVPLAPARRRRWRRRA